MRGTLRGGSGEHKIHNLGGDGARVLHRTEGKEPAAIVHKSGVWPLLRCVGAALVLIAGLAGVACVQDTWVEVPALHPGDMTPSELEAWQVELGRINDALTEIDDEHEYKRKEYECDSFSDYTAGELAARCFVVKRAMSYTFQYQDGRTGLHHWIFVVVQIVGREVWVPVECTPANGERQKQYGCDGGAGANGGCPSLRVGQLPRVADEAYYSLVASALKSGQRFDERYFGSIIVWDVATECSAPLPTDREPAGGRACPPGNAVVLAD